MSDEKTPLKLSPLREWVIPVDDWKPNKEDLVMSYSGKCMIIPFDKYIDRVDTDYLNIFYVTFKDSYVKQFEHIAQYVNYFIKYYDDLLLLQVHD